MQQEKTAQISLAKRRWLSDAGQLVKWRLTLTVVFSAVMSYAIAAQGAAQLLPMLVLGIGGFLVAGAANALNQILERDYDKLMERTADRPVASNRMAVSEGVVIAGLMLLFGVIALALFNPLTAFMGTLSFIIYAFIYTPLKRYSTLAVAVGAIPGALPAMIGCVAFEGQITWLAVVLFAIQFLWQFPHFWAIGTLAFDQYQAAGFKLLPVDEGKLHPSLGLSTLFYSLLLIPVCFLAYYFGVSGLITTGLLLATSLWYIYLSYGFFRQFDRTAARRLMFGSFAYLPLMLIIILLGGML